MSMVDFMLSERQRRMLGVLLMNPDSQFGTNELLSIGGPGVGAGRNVLRSFEKADLVVRSTRGNQVVYSINKRNPIFPELRSICLKTFGVKDVVAEGLKPFADHIKLAFIFGSIVKGTARSGSDVDLMVVGDVDIFEMGEVVGKMGEVLGREVDLQLHTPEDWERLKDDRVIRGIMEGEKIMVVGA